MKSSTRIQAPQTFVLIGFAFVLVLLATRPTPLGATEVNTGYFGNVAIQGYDPVAYFTEGRPTKGSEAHTHKWLGAYWRFASEKHRKMFSDNPQSYAPQYGGHCATGLAIHGNLTKDIDPEAWVIIDGRLYLNYSNETNKLLLEGKVTIDKADKAWAKATH